MTPREKRIFQAGYLAGKRECVQFIAEFLAALDEVHSELSDVRSELVRRHQLDEAAAVERDPETWVN